MVKVPIGDLNAFAEAIIDLLNHSHKRNKIGRQAEQFIYTSYSWDFRAKQVLSEVIK